MPLEVEVLAEDNHQFVLRIESLLDKPHIGDPITCGDCGKLTKVKLVGFPGRVREGNPPKGKQDKLFKE